MEAKAFFLERVRSGGMEWMEFSGLAGVGGWLRHGMVGRVAGVEVGDGVDRGQVLERLGGVHGEVVRGLGCGWESVVRAEQVHGGEVAWVEAGVGRGVVVAGVDGLATNAAGGMLGIYVADCCAVFLVDAVKRAVALVHSGRRGSEQGIVRRAIEVLVEQAGSRPEDLVVQLSPCIRPPRYEVDFAAWIRRDARACGVPSSQIFDDGQCTASNLGRFYSYRAERGRTGRMLALLGLAADSCA